MARRALGRGRSADIRFNELATIKARFPDVELWELQVIPQQFHM